MWLLTADLHLTDRPKDAYRFGIFKWLAKQQDKYDAKVAILGDLTDKKDRHSSALVNRIVDELLHLRPPVYLLMGNHDYIDIESPFFKFLNHLRNVHFVTKPACAFGVGLVPHCRDQIAFDQACDSLPADLTGLLTHQTFDGAIAETGSRLTGLNTAAISRLGPRWAYAGDIHRPQKVGPVTYVGAPYTVRFGDDFEPRVVLVAETTDQKKRETNLYFDCPRKWSLTINDASDITKNKNLLAKDQVKIIVTLAREEVVEWPTFKAEVLEACAQKELEVFGVKMQVSGSLKRDRIMLGEAISRLPEDVLTAYCRKENAPSQTKKAGMAVLKGTYRV